MAPSYLISSLFVFLYHARSSDPILPITIHHSRLGTHAFCPLVISSSSHLDRSPVTYACSSRNNKLHTLPLCTLMCVLPSGTSLRFYFYIAHFWTHVQTPLHLQCARGFWGWCMIVHGRYDGCGRVVACFIMTWLACGLSIHWQQVWGLVLCFLSTVEGFPKVLGFGGTRGHVHVCVCKVGDIWWGCYTWTLCRCNHRYLSDYWT